MIALSKIIGEETSDLAKRYNRQIPISKITGMSKSPEENSEESGGISDRLLDALKTAGTTAAGLMPYNLLVPDGATGFTGGLLAEGIGNALQTLGNPDRTLAAQYSPDLASALRSAGDVAQGIADSAIEYGQGKINPRNNDEIVGALRNAYDSGFFGVMGGNASMIHSDKAAKAINEAVQQLADENGISPELSLEYLLNPHGFTRSVGQTAGSMGAILPSMMLMPESAAVAPASAITRYLINRGAYGMAKHAANSLPSMIRYAATSPWLEGMAEGGHVRADNLAQGVNDEEATRRSINTMLANVPVLAGSNFLEAGLLGIPFFRATTSPFQKVIQAALATGLNAGQQGTEEALQKAISNWQTDKEFGVAPWNWTPDQWEDFKEGFAGTLPMGIVSGGIHATKRPDENVDNWEKGSPEKISVEDFSTRAQKQSKQTQYDNLRSWANEISGGVMSDEVFNSVVRNAQAYGVPVKLALAQATAESNGNQNVTSPAGAIGVMQLLPGTAQELGVDPNDTEQNIRGGMKYLKQQYDKYGDWNLALAAYNAGAGAVDKAGGIPNYSETQNYVDKINKWAQMNEWLDDSPIYERDTNTRSKGVHYLGENGAGEGKYWVRQGDNVSIEGAQPQLANAIDMLAKYYYERTGKRLVVTAATNGDHADGEHSHAAGWKVDVNDYGFGEDGALTTPEGKKGWLTDEFIRYGRSLGLGMNWEGGANKAHIDVALDGTQWDGAFDSDAGGFSPDNIRQNTHQADLSQRQQQQGTTITEQPESAELNPLFDINAEDEQTKKLFEQFAREKYAKAIDDEDVDAVKFFVGNLMFDLRNNFINTKENRNAIRNIYGNEFIKWALAQPEQVQLKQEKPKPKQGNAEQENPFLADQSLTNSINKLREQAVQSGNAPLLTRIQAAQNNPNELRNILKQNGVAVSAPTQTQPQPSQAEDVVSKNTTPDNVITQPNQSVDKATAKLIARAKKPVATGKSKTARNARISQGNALFELANQNNIQLSNSEVANLVKGDPVTLTQVQSRLKQAGAFDTTPLKNKTPQSGMVERKEANGITIFTPADQVNRPTSMNDRARAIIQQQQKQQALEHEADLANEDEETVLPDVIPRNDEFTEKRNRRIDDDLLKLEDEQGRFEESQRKAQERAQWEAKRDKEVAELEARKAEAKRLADKRRQREKIQEEFYRRGGYDLEIDEAEENESQRQRLLREEERLENEEARRNTTPEELRRNYRNAQHLGNANAEAKRIQLADEGRRQRDIELAQLKSKSQKARIEAGKEILRTLRSPQYQTANAKVEATPGLKTALQNGSVEAIRQARNFIADLDEEIHEAQDVSRPTTESAQQENISDRNAEVKTSSKNPAQIRLSASQPVNETGEQSPNSTEQEPAPKQMQEVIGDTDEIITESRRPINIRYKAIESSALIPSHLVDTQFSNVYENPKYPKQINGVKIQPRDRTRPEMQAQIISMGNNLSPKDLMAARTVNQGAPVVMNDGVVLNGNGRTSAIIYAYDEGKADAYKQYLIGEAKKFGLNSNEITKMNQPILVRAVEDGLSVDELQEIVADDTGGAQMNQTEKALSDKDKLDFSVLNDIAQDGLPDPTTMAGRHQYIDILQKIATSNELAGYVNSAGKLSINGIQRAQNAILSLAYGDENGTITELTTSPDNNVKNITNALINSAVAVAKLRLLMKKGQAHDYNLNFIGDAVAKLSALRYQGKPVKEFLKEISLMGTFNEETRETLRFFDSHKKDSKKISKFLSQLVEDIQAQGNPSEETIPFFDSEEFRREPAPLMDLIKTAEEKAEAEDDTPKNNSTNFAIPSVFSHVGDVDTKVNNIIDDRDLTSLQKLLRSFGQKLGVKTIFFDGSDGRFHGKFADNTIYINAKSNMPIAKVFWHESMHWLKANNPALFKALAKAAGITDAQRKAYLERTKRTDLTSNEAIDEEIIADAMQDIAKRNGLLQTIAGKDRNLIHRVIQWLQDTINKFIDHFRNPDGKLTTEQAIRLADEFGKIAHNLTDADGKQIFRYNRQTHNVEVIGGRTFEKTPVLNTIKNNDGKPKYSIGAEDNSHESLSHKIRSKIAAYTGNSKSSARRNKRITETIQKITGHRILFNSVKDADGTIIDDFNKVIKTPHAYEWEDLLPQIGGKFAQSLKLNPTEKMSNYIADWILTGALNNTTAEKTTFQKAMRDNPAMAELFQNIRKDFQEYADLAPEERIGETIQHKKDKTLLERLGDIRHNFQEQFIDDLHPIYRMLEEMKKNVPSYVAKQIDEAINVYKKARLVRGKGAIANMMIDGSRKDIEKIRSALQEQYPDMYFDRLKSIRMILEDVGLFEKNLDKTAKEKRLNQFESYCVAKLDKEIHEKNHAGDMEVKPQFKESDDDATIAKFEKEFGQAQRDLVTFSNILLTMQFKSGVISFDQYAKTIKSWKNYIPMARVFDENEEYDFTNSFKRKTGSKRDTWSPIAKIIYNAQEFIAQAERNKVKLELADLVRCGGYGEFAAEVEQGSKDKGNIVTFKENGQLKRLNVYDIAIARAIDSIQGKEESTWIMKALRSSSRLLRAMYTVSNPDYAAGNIFRDMADAFIHNKNLSSNPVVALMETWRAGMTEIFSRSKTQDFYDWLASGGSQSGFVSEGLDYAQMEINDLLKGGRKERYTGGIKSFFSQALDDINKLAELSEYATRRTTYKSSLNNLAATRADGKATVQDKANAALESRNASIDFAKGGRSMKQINRVILFSNAAVQSWALWGKAFKDAKTSSAGRKALAGKVFRAVSQGIFLSVLQALANYSDDDRRKEYQQANDWERDTYWIFGGFKMPKGVDVGIRLMSALTEEAIGKVVANDPFEWMRIGKAFTDALPSLTATIFTPWLETSLNSSWFRDAPIVPYTEQKLPARLQYGAETTSIAKIFGDKFNYSPRKIDYLINGYLGFMGRFFSRVPDYALGNRALDWDEVPMVRRFYFSPYNNPKIVKDYYEAYNEQEELYAGYKLERDKGENVDLPKDYDRTLHQRLKAAREPMRNLSKAEKKILDNPKLDSNQRTEKLQELEKKRIELCEKVFRQAR